MLLLVEQETRIGSSLEWVSLAGLT